MKITKFIRIDFKNQMSRSLSPLAALYLTAEGPDAGRHIVYIIRIK
jgi:hypothetical protein